MGDAQMNNPLDASLLRRLDQDARILHGLLKGKRSTTEPDPISVVEGGRTDHAPGQFAWGVEPQRSHVNFVTERIRAAGMPGKRPDSFPQGKELARDVFAVVAERPGHDVEVGLSDWLLVG